MTMRYGADRPLAAWGRGMRADHIGLDPGLVDEDEMLGVQTCLVVAPCRPCGRDVQPVLLGGVEGVFCVSARWPTDNGALMCGQHNALSDQALQQLIQRLI
jgi:hypothetical protein